MVDMRFDADGSFYNHREMSSRDNLKIDQEKLEEFLRLVNMHASKEPRALTLEEVQAVEGKSYYGTSLFMVLLSLYMLGGIQRIRDLGVFGNEEKRVIVKPLFVTGDKEVARAYANERLKGAESRRYIFSRLLEDNGLERLPFPNFLLQPIVLGFDQAPIKDKFLHKPFEGILYKENPNRSSLNALANIYGQSVIDFTSGYPILSSFFKHM